MQDSKATELFEKAPVSQAVLKSALPAMAAMLMVLIYNLADTFFVGQTHDAYQVAAVSLAMPVFLMFMAVGTVFGMGGTSVISRALGQGRTEYAQKVCSFCMWGCVVVGVIMAALFLLFMDPILTLVGASESTWEYARSYLVIVSFSGPFVLISNAFSNIVRAEGKSAEAMMGQLLGNLLNVILDPLMILTLGWNITGAAIATVIGNVVGAVYYILYFVRGKSSLSVDIRKLSGPEKVCFPVCSIGIPAALGSVLMSISQIVSTFLSDPAAYSYAVSFSRILLTTSFLFGVFYVLINMLQAMGAATPALIINLSRQGIIFIPALFVLQAVMGINGLIWAQPVADVLSIVLAVALYLHTARKMEKESARN